MHNTSLSVSQLCVVFCTQINPILTYQCIDKILHFSFYTQVFQMFQCFFLTINHRVLNIKKINQFLLNLVKGLHYFKFAFFLKPKIIPISYTLFNRTIVIFIDYNIKIIITLYYNIISFKAIMRKKNYRDFLGKTKHSKTVLLLHKIGSIFNNPLKTAFLNG